MLKIIYGRLEADNFVYNPDEYFNFNREDSWLEDKVAKQMVEDIDKSEIIGPNLIHSDILGPIPPEYLSGGVKTLICIKNRPDLIFNATACGDNCSNWLLKLAENQNIIINLYYCMQFKEPFEIEILNTGDICHTREELYGVIAGQSSYKVNYKNGVVNGEWRCRDISWLWED